MIFKIIDLIFLFVGSCYILCVGCELRNYKGGHKYIKAFYAKTPLQKFFTIFQLEKDIYKSDIGKVTYIGYIGAILSITIILIIIPFLIYNFIVGNFYFGERIIKIWGIASISWGILAVLIQGFDSLLNRFLQ